MKRSVRARLYLLSFVDDFGPLYAVYTLWFNDNGITTAQISTVFLGWAAIALFLEIPSGALADRVDRRRLIAVAFGMRAAGIVVWLLWPTLTGVAIGAVLWAMHDALASGSWEALVHDELSATGDAGSYASVMARISQCSNLGVAAGTLGGAALLHAGSGLALLGWVTALAPAGSIALVLGLPDVRWVAAASDPDNPDDPDDPDDGSFLGWWATMRAGVAEVRRSPVLGRLVVVGALLEGLFLIDEYVPLLARARGGDDSFAPVIVLVVWLGLLLGGELAARRPAHSGRVVGVSLVVSMAITGIAFVSDGLGPLGLIAIGYGVLQIAYITADARLQAHAPRAIRATVTSVRGFFSALVSMAMLVVVGALTRDDDPSHGLLVLVGVLMLTGLLVARWLPSSAVAAPHSSTEDAPAAPASGVRA